MFDHEEQQVVAAGWDVLAVIVAAGALVFSWGFEAVAVVAMIWFAGEALRYMWQGLRAMRGGMPLKA